MLTESKVKLAECMTEDFKAKSKIEIQILNILLRPRNDIYRTRTH